MGAGFSLSKTLFAFGMLATFGACYVYAPRTGALDSPPPGSPDPAAKDDTDRRREQLLVQHGREGIDALDGFKTSDASLEAPTSPPPMQAPELLTKRQRQASAHSKLTKDKVDRLREQTLAKHRRDRINELSSSSGGSKTPSGGRRVTVDEDGRLIWS
ncbi:hypothetical protein AURDEDRAFT_162681 [Auricularia subglabra TFB-10046 SS5]|nr:hypothetical protein AURDEDRAFT_162681 [Auricularia subglabra TFB-10046 SS5]